MSTAGRAPDPPPMRRPRLRLLASCLLAPFPVLPIVAILIYRWSKHVSLNQFSDLGPLVIAVLATSAAALIVAAVAFVISMRTRAAVKSPTVAELADKYSAASAGPVTVLQPASPPVTIPSASPPAPPAAAPAPTPPPPAAAPTASTFYEQAASPNDLQRLVLAAEAAAPAPAPAPQPSSTRLIAAPPVPTPALVQPGYPPVESRHSIYSRTSAMPHVPSSPIAAATAERATAMRVVAPAAPHTRTAAAPIDHPPVDLPREPAWPLPSPPAWANAPAPTDAAWIGHQ